MSLYGSDTLNIVIIIKYIMHIKHTIYIKYTMHKCTTINYKMMCRKLRFYYDNVHNNVMIKCLTV